MQLQGFDGLVTLGIAGFFLWHLLKWAIGTRILKIAGIIIVAAFLYHILGMDGEVSFEEWWVVIGVLAGIFAFVPKKKGKNKKAGKAKASHR